MLYQFLVTKKQLILQGCDEDNMKNDLTKAVFGNALSKSATLSEHLQMLNDMNLLNIGELAEIAISKTSKVDRCTVNQEGYDLVNGLEIKHAQTHERSAKGNTMSAWISIKNKTGDILAVVSESKTKKQYFFNLPHNYYRSFNANAIGVPFEADGRPRRFQKRSSGFTSPWYYEVSDYKTLCDIASQR